MKSAAGHSGLSQALHALSATIGIISQCKRLESKIDEGNSILETVNSTMPYNLSESEKNLARFGNRVEIVVALELGGKISEQDAFDRIKYLYKEFKQTYKSDKPSSAKQP